MSEALFPSGPWTGYYKYSGQSAKHRMDLHLQFTNGRVTGEGIDDIGRFSIRGHYDARELECYWTKTYVGAHDVYYRGFREGKGIWGVWEIGLRARGGFHIWPKGAEEGDSQVAQAEEPVPAHAAPAEVPALIARGRWDEMAGSGRPRFQRFAVSHLAASQLNATKRNAVGPALSLPRASPSRCLELAEAGG